MNEPILPDVTVAEGELMQTDIVIEQSVTTESSNLVDQSMAEQYSTYSIDLSKNISPKISTGSKYNDEANFFKSCKWSPDGSCVLTNSNDNIARVFQPSAEVFSEVPDGGQLVEVVQAKEAEPIYESCWYPLMNSQDPATCCFLTSARDHPVHLWDCTTGKLRASYSVIDHRERFMGAIGLTFNLDGSSIYCGYENMIQVFDTSRPGSTAVLKISTTPTRKSRMGQKGIISSLAFSPDYSGLLAAGSYSKNIGLYDTSSGEICSLLGGLDGGVTQVKFSPSGTHLFSANRQSNLITCWDVRNTGDVFCRYERPGYTNQRISFDIDSSGQVLASGDMNGSIRLFNLSTAAEDDKLIEPEKIMSGHQGQRKFNIDEESDNDSDELPIDNSVQLWHLPGSWTAYESYPTEDPLE
ncbi:unnamed protein product [Umbelopsis sp. WA50703]